MVMSPKKPENAAFSPGPHHGNVVLNSAGKPTEEFDRYGEAFRKAGQSLAENLANNRAFLLDFDACPIVFLYRQAIELYLKAILRSGQCMLSLEGSPLTFGEHILTQHPLSPFLGPLRPLFEELGWSKSYDQCAAFISDLDVIDPISFAFRYPVDKKDVGPLPDYFVFNVLKFAARAEEVLCVLYEMVHGIEDRIEQIEETAQWLSELSDGY